jgi:hypothetical protein
MSTIDASGRRVCIARTHHVIDHVAVLPFAAYDQQRGSYLLRYLVHFHVLCRREARPSLSIISVFIWRSSNMSYFHAIS